MSCRHTQCGFSLPVAIFILVVLALLGAAMVGIMLNSSRALGSAVLSTRAFFAAQSGAQYALAQLFPLTGAPASCAAAYPTLTFTASGLAGCNAVVSCSSQTIGSQIYYTLNSTGSCSAGGDSAVRQIQVQAKQP